MYTEKRIVRSKVLYDGMFTKSELLKAHLVVLLCVRKCFLMRRDKLSIKFTHQIINGTNYPNVNVKQGSCENR